MRSNGDAVNGKSFSVYRVSFFSGSDTVLSRFGKKIYSDLVPLFLRKMGKGPGYDWKTRNMIVVMPHAFC